MAEPTTTTCAASASAAGCIGAGFAAGGFLTIDPLLFLAAICGGGVFVLSDTAQQIPIIKRIVYFLISIALGFFLGEFVALLATEALHKVGIKVSVPVAVGVVGASAFGVTLITRVLSARNLKDLLDKGEHA